MSKMQKKDKITVIYIKGIRSMGYNNHYILEILYQTQKEKKDAAKRCDSVYKNTKDGSLGLCHHQVNKKFTYH